jgi:hypothetical protein
MGRPIKKKFFGNLNNQGFGSVDTDSGIGGESISSTITVTNTGTVYSQGSVVTFSAPSLPTGVTATGTPVFTANGTGAFGITAVTLTGAGRGYTGTATITITTASSVTPTATAVDTEFTLTNLSSVAGIYVGMKFDGAPGVQANTYVTAVGATTVTLSKAMTASTSSNAYVFNDYGTGAQFITAVTASTQNALNVTAYIPAKNGGASAKLSDIVKQEASQRYLVKNTDGIGQCKLVASDTPAAGQMNLIATDTNGSTYWVTKLTARRCILTRRTMSTAYLFATNGSAGWTIASASTGVVSIGSV